jgi:hypothetical protein
MPKLSHRRKAIAVAVSGVLLAAGAGAAYAYWSAAGTGAGTATESSASTPFTITNTVPTGLAPGGSVTVNGTITNNNATTSEFVNTVSAVLTLDAGHSGCLAADFTLAPVLVNARVLKSAVKTFTASLSMTDTGVNQDACKGATVNIAWSSN